MFLNWVSFFVRARWHLADLSVASAIVTLTLAGLPPPVADEDVTRWPPTKVRENVTSQPP